MPSKTARRKPSRTRATTRASTPATALPPSAPGIPHAALEVLLKKLAPFLETLSANELADIPTAANALAQRPRGARAILHPRPPQPVEVVLARVGREVVGALLLSRKWMERTFDESPDNASADPTETRSAALSEWLNGFGRLLGSSLLNEMALVDAQGYMQEPSDCLDMLEHYAKTRANEFERLWSLPLTQYFLPSVKNGTPVERRRLRALEKRRLTDGRGRPHVEREESHDFIIAEKVEAAVTHLKPGWDYLRANQAEGRRQKREELIGMGYQGDEADVLVDGHHRRLRGAAVLLVAQHSSRSVESISAQASRATRR